jgi:hypothetical protein
MVSMFHSLLQYQVTLHRFLVLPPPLHKSWDEISFRGRAVTPYVMEFLMIFIRFIIKHETLWLIKTLGKLKEFLKLNLQEQVKNS